MLCINMCNLLQVKFANELCMKLNNMCKQNKPKDTISETQINNNNNPV